MSVSGPVRRTSTRAIVALAAIACATIGSACDGDDATPDSSGHWVVLLEDLPGAILSVWTGQDMVYAVGADDGSGPTVLRHSDGAWSRLDTGESGDLWWVAADPSGRLWMVGDGGLVLRHTAGSETFERVDIGTDATLFGIFFADADNAWTVGGWLDDTGGGVDGQRGAVFHLQGDTFAPETRVSDALLMERVIYKAWGTGPEDMWLVGERGVMLHSVGGDFEALDTMVSGRLLTIHGTQDFGPIAVGGENNAALLEHDGEALVDRSFDVDEGFAPALNGVFVVDAQRTIVVGNSGFIAERNADGQFELPRGPGDSGEDGNNGAPIERPTDLHLHAVSVDAAGGAWAVGGNLLSETLDGGLILYKGPQQPGREL